MKKSTKSNSINDSLLFIKSKCQQINQNPSKINNLNLILQKYLDIQISEDEQQRMYVHKLQSFLEICQLVKKLTNNKFSLCQNSTKNNNSNVLSNFIEQKSKVLIQIFITSQLLSNLKNELLFYLCSQKLYQILIVLSQTNQTILNQKLIQNLIIAQVKNQSDIPAKSLIQFYQLLTSGSYLSSLLQNLNQKLSLIDSSSKSYQKQLEYISLFITSLPTLSQLVFNTGTIDHLQKVFQTLFLNILGFIQNFSIHHPYNNQLAVALYRKIDSKLLSKMNNPLILANYFLDKFKQDPAIQIQVLSCLFILVGKYGLEFQNFYPQLEKLITQKTKDGQSIYRLKNSKRFFKLVQTALRSSKVPFKTIETMTKTILSQIMQEQSEFTFWALAFFFNLTKKHRKLLDLIKQLPQLHVLTRHYNPKVRSLVNELKKDLNKAQYLDIDKFSKIDCRKITKMKIQELSNKLNHENQAQFKITGLIQDL